MREAMRVLIVELFGEDQQVSVGERNRFATAVCDGLFGWSRRYTLSAAA